MDKRRMCPHCRAFITTDDKICPYCNNEVGPRAVERDRPADALGGLIPQAQFTTVVLLLINTGLYVATLLYTSRLGGESGFDPSARALFDFGAKYPSAIFAGQWWRLITAGFLHGGILHILMNSLALYQLGAQSEEAYGTPRFLVIYLMSSASGFLMSTYWSNSLSIGASAAIYGLIGAMIAFGVRDRSFYGRAMRSFYIQWAVFGLMMSFFGPIDMGAHIGGLAGGFLVGLIAGPPGRIPAIERLWQLCAVFALLITGVAFFDMVQFLLHSTT